MLASSGEITVPCPVPLSLTVRNSRPLRYRSFEAQSHTPCNRCVRFVTTVASGYATLTTKRALPLTWAGLPPAGSHQLAAGALIRLLRRRGRAETLGPLGRGPSRC